ncbi:hypothetical protein LIA77_05421 [Sarocladium implicatum]|nr:hypothetical protein LIA77_05421 [Sarocladium implicatum]
MVTADGPSQDLIIILSTTIPGVALVAILGATIYCCRRRKFRFLNRGITPIDDEEIESWRTEKYEEKIPAPSLPESPKRHQQSVSTSSIQKPPSIIVYGRDTQFTTRPSVDRSPGYGRPSVEASAPVIAVAPNARPGLTDDMIQGDDAFVARVKRQPSRLAKVQPPPSPGKPQHTRSSSSMHATWYGYQESSQYSSTVTRYSSDRRPQTPPQGFHNHTRVYSSSSIPPISTQDEDFYSGGLSPRPLLRQSDIGRAIG